RKMRSSQGQALAPGVDAARPAAALVRRRHTPGIDAAFLVLVGTPGGQLTEQARELVSNPCPPGLHFPPQSHHVWTDAPVTPALGFWQGGLAAPAGRPREPRVPPGPGDRAAPRALR